MNYGFTVRSLILSSLCVIVLIFAGAIFTSSQEKCEDIKDYSSSPSQEPARLCEKTDPAQEIVSLSMGSSQAFGTESSSFTLDSLFLDNPNKLTKIGTLPIANLMIGGCEFDNSGNFDELYCIAQTGEFFTVSTSDATSSPIGIVPQINNEQFTGLAEDPTTGIMYLCSGDFEETSSIFTIILNNANTTRIGTVTNSPGGLAACAFDNFGQMYGIDIINDVLLKIDKTTGAGTVVGPTGFDATAGQGMDFNEVDNTCYYFAFNNDPFRAELRTCDTTDGSTTLVGVLGLDARGWFGGAAIAERFTISPISPSIVSNFNSMSAITATPSGGVAFIYGFMPGSKVIGGSTCNGSRLDIEDPRLFKIVNAGSDETAKLNFYLPHSPLWQMPVYTQAVDIESCRVSNLILNIIRTE